jgi:hypothetical protein
VLKQLKRRLSNVKPVAKPRRPSPGKRKNIPVQNDDVLKKRKVNSIDMAVQQKHAARLEVKTTALALPPRGPRKQARTRRVLLPKSRPNDARTNSEHVRNMLVVFENEDEELQETNCCGTHVHKKSVDIVKETFKRLTFNFCIECGEITHCGCLWHSI